MMEEWEKGGEEETGKRRDKQDRRLKGSPFCIIQDSRDTPP